MQLLEPVICYSLILVYCVQALPIQDALVISDNSQNMNNHALHSKTIPKEKENSAMIAIGDMILLRNPDPNSRAARLQYRWPRGEIPYKVASNVGQVTLQKVVHAMARISKGTCIKFRRATKRDNYWVNLNSDLEKCSATVGWVDAPGGDEQTANFGEDCSEGNIVHELMHTVGLFHEQGRDDRDQFVVIRRENIEQGHEFNFVKTSERGYETTAFRILYNYGSIMHYGATFFSNNGKNTIDIKPNHPKAYGKESDMGQRDTITPADKQLMQALYKCSPSGQEEDGFEDDDWWTDAGSLFPNEVHVVEEDAEDFGLGHPNPEGEGHLGQCE